MARKQLPWNDANNAARAVLSAINKGDDAWALDNLCAFLPHYWTLPRSPMAVEFNPRTLRGLAAAYRKYAVEIRI